LLDLGDEIRIDLHLRIDLPTHEAGLFAQAPQVRDADEIPFRLRAHIDQRGLGVLAQPLPCLGRRYISRVAHTVTRCALFEIDAVPRLARDSTNGRPPLNPLERSPVRRTDRRNQADPAPLGRN
jgi:hypothetical protein